MSLSFTHQVFLVTAMRSIAHTQTCRTKTAFFARSFCVFVTVFALLPGTLHADVTLPAIISDNMVLQQNANARVWGWADPGEKVSVTLGGQIVSSVANAERYWEVMLEPIVSSGPMEMTIAGKNTLTVRNLLVGEVWVGAGQSNMWWPVSRTSNAGEEISKANYPKLRLFTVPVQASRVPLDDIPDPLMPTQPVAPPIAFPGRWVECSSETIGDFSGVAYYFGRDLHRDLGVPVGMIAMSVGGSVAEAWTSEESLAKNPVTRRVRDHWDNYEISQYAAKKAEYEKKLAAWKRDSAQPEPAPPVDPAIYVNRAGSLFNGMVSPVLRFTISGVLWYQGESNAIQGALYSHYLKAVVTDWQEAWNLGALPFFIVQLPNADPTLFSSVGDNWPAVREAQAEALEIPGTAMAVTIDIGAADDLHPPNKQEVGRRLARLAEGLVYGKNISYTGPSCQSVQVTGNKARLQFRTGGGGLVAKDGKLVGFRVAGADGRFFDAKAEIAGNNVVVWSDEVPEPVAVRYAWANNPRGNLFNEEGFPTGPFRTDDWELAAVGETP